MITIDNVNYNASWSMKGYKQTADILNGDQSGRLQGTKSMYLQYVGTFFNSIGTIRRERNCTDTEWNSLFRVLSNPENDHTVKIPFDDGYMITEIYVSKCERTLLSEKPKRVWSKTYEVTFTAMDSQWLAGGTLQGYSEG